MPSQFNGNANGENLRHKRIALRDTTKFSLEISEILKFWEDFFENSQKMDVDAWMRLYKACSSFDLYLILGALQIPA